MVLVWKASEVWPLQELLVFRRRVRLVLSVRQGQPDRRRLWISPVLLCLAPPFRFPDSRAFVVYLLRAARLAVQVCPADRPPVFPENPQQELRMFVGLLRVRRFPADRQVKAHPVQPVTVWPELPVKVPRGLQDTERLAPPVRQEMQMLVA